MKRSYKTAALAAVAVFAFPAMAAAQQMMAAAATDLNMRAGPSPNHQVLGVIPGGQGVTVHECTASRNWCLVSFGGQTGWSYSPYLDITDTVAVAGYPPVADDRGPLEIAGPPRRGTAPFGFAGGALAGGLIGGWPGAIIGGTAGAFTDTATGFGEPGWTSSRGPMEVPTLESP